MYFNRISLKDNCRQLWPGSWRRHPANQDYALAYHSPCAQHPDLLNDRPSAAARSRPCSATPVRPFCRCVTSGAVRRRSRCPNRERLGSLPFASRDCLQCLSTVRLYKCFILWNNVTAKIDPMPRFAHPMRTCGATPSAKRVAGNMAKFIQGDCVIQIAQFTLAPATGVIVADRGDGK